MRGDPQSPPTDSDALTAQPHSSPEPRISADLGRRREDHRVSGDAVIRVTRVGDGARDLLRAYTVLVDGASVGKVRRGESVETAVEPGAHTVQVKIDWEGSGEWGVTLASGEAAEFVCKPGRALPIASSPEFYIDLQPLDAD